MSCPWGKLEQSEPVDLKVIISQEVTRNLQAKEEKKCPEMVENEVFIIDEAETEANDKDCDKEISGDEEETDWDTYELSEGDQRIESKHDVTVSGRKHTSKLSSKVFKSLDLHSYNEEFQRYKVLDKKKRQTSTLFGIDPRACYLIRKMIKDKVVEKVTDIIRFEKGYVMIQVTSSSWLLCWIIVFKPDKGRLTACQKAKNEVAKCKKLQAVGIPCSRITALREHVLVTSHETPLKVKTFHAINYEYEPIYNNVKKMMYKFYNVANLIHANLSESNIIVSYWNTVYFINLNNSVEPSHENAFDYLFKDCTRVIDYFRKGITDIEEPDNLFEYITGHSFLNKESLLKLQDLIRK